LAIWGAVLTGLSLPLPALILLAGFLGMGGIGAHELWITMGCIVCLGIPGTLLGWMALSQIRRSQGQLQGLPLALFAALMWPLLVPFLGTLLPPALIVTPEPMPWGPALLLLPIGVLIFDVWAVRAVARWGRGGITNPGGSRTGQIPIPPSGTAAPAGTANVTPWSKTAIVAAALAALGLFPPLLMIVIAIYLSMPFDHSFTAGNLSKQFLFGTVVTLAPAIVGTLVGFFALREIRLAAGQLRGRRLALWASLFWPLLFLDVLLMSLAAGTGGRLAVKLGGGMGAFLMIVPLVLLVLLALDVLVFAKMWRWAISCDVLTPGQRRSPVLVAVALCAGLGIMIPALALGFSVWMPMLAKASR
jgi:hypothetical protein